MYKKTVLDNGLRIISHHMPGRQSVALGIFVKIGGRYESFEHKGIAHFLEHLVFKGTKNYSCRRIKESIEGVGGSLNGFTSEELTCYLVKIPFRYLSRAFDVLSEMVVYPAIPAAEFEKERTVILEEIKMYRDLPQSYVQELLDELLWPRQPLGAPIIGTNESVSKIQRGDLAAFHRQHYVPVGVVVSAAGGVRHEDLTELVRKKFSGIPGGSAAKCVVAEESPKTPQLNVFHKETEQSHLALGFHGFRRDHPLRHALGILHIILGANMSSRLFNEVREKRGLAYEIGTQVKRYQDTGAFIVHAGIDNHKVEECVALIMKELSRVRHRLVQADEFRRAQEFYQGQLMLALEDTLDHMLWIGETTATLNRTYAFADIIKEVRAVTTDDVREVARVILKEQHLNAALIGPLRERHGAVLKTLTIR